ncbi:hypothetical protein F5Y11DRAFT_351432 [Daldinia sp. FL1419]|nr:hypothetical protein F5Y11DRAFT_351432 [Daldinia sp. FL1419]
MLHGTLTGDMWLCAAASALAWRDKDHKTIQPYPVTVIGVVDYNINPNSEKKIQHASLKDAMMALTQEYFHHMALVYTEHVKDLFGKVWNATKVADLWNGGRLVDEDLVRGLPLIERESLPSTPAVLGPSPAPTESESPDDPYFWQLPKNYIPKPAMQLMTSTSHRYVVPPRRQPSIELGRIDILRHWLSSLSFLDTTTLPTSRLVPFPRSLR